MTQSELTRLRLAVRGVLRGAGVVAPDWRPGYSARGMEGRRCALAVAVPRGVGPATESGRALEALGLAADALGEGWVWYVGAAHPRRR